EIVGHSRFINLGFINPGRVILACSDPDYSDPECIDLHCKDSSYGDPGSSDLVARAGNLLSDEPGFARRQVGGTGGAGTEACAIGYRAGCECKFKRADQCVRSAGGVR